MTETELKRDCQAVRIPAGTAVTLPAGTLVDITQALGGTFTVRGQGGLYQIEGRDADALGIEPGALPNATAAAAAEAPANREELEAAIWQAMKSCYDPEIPVNIVDLGLIYDLRLEPTGSGDHAVSVKMTLTAPGCGMGPAIAGNAQEKILMLPGVASAEVEVVWDPPWHQSMISEEGRRVLGLL